MQFGRQVTTVGKYATSTFGGKLIQVLLVMQWYLPNELQDASPLRKVSKIFAVARTPNLTSAILISVQK
jgi:predicted component of type VI protein secretion system